MGQIIGIVFLGALVLGGLFVLYVFRFGRRPELQNEFLFDAVAAGKYGAVRSFLKQGADPNARSENPVMVEPHDGEGHPQGLSIPQFPETSVLMLATGAGRVPAIELLVAAGAEVDARDAEGRTALMYAALMEQSEAAQALLAAGADVNARSTEGQTALGIARELGKPGVLSVLEAAGGVE